MKVEALELVSQYSDLKRELLGCLEKMLSTGQFVLGPDVEGFEKDIAAYLGVKGAVAVSSGTDALWLALKAIQIRPGDKVLTSPFTFFATVSALLNSGAGPVFGDIDPHTLNLDPEKVEDILKRDTKRQIRAIMPVHLYGLGADMTAFNSLAKKYDVKVIEDAAQAMGAKLGGHRPGSLGHVGCFSFYPTKNLGCLGDGGLVCSQDAEIVDRLKRLRTHGSTVRYYHERIGSNCRMDTIQASFLRVFLPRLDGWISERRKIAKHYDSGLSSLNPLVQHQKSDEGHGYHQYTVRVAQGKRDRLKEYLSKNEISSVIYYPIPCHLQEALGPIKGKAGDFPEAEKAAEEVLSLPIYPGLSLEKQDFVLKTIKDFTSLQ